MSGRLLRVSLAVMVVLSLFLSGCLFGGRKITSLELETSASSISFGDTVELSAHGVTENGKVVSVVPEWEIVAGAGTLGIQNSKRRIGIMKAM